METGVTQDLISCIQKEFELTPVDIRTYSPLTLAYIGDGVYELIIRTVLVEQGNLQPAKLHKKSSGLCLLLFLLFVFPPAGCDGHNAARCYQEKCRSNISL